MELSIITDEVSQDPHEAAQFAVEHGARLVALRSVWGRNIMQCDDEHIEALAAVLKSYELRVSSVLSPLFKCHVPGAPQNELADPHFVGFPPVFAEHMAQAHRLPEIAARLDAPVIRIFTFLTDGAAGTLSAGLRDVISDAVEGWQGVGAAVENEFVCHVRTLSELQSLCSSASATLGAVLDPCNHHVAVGGDGLDDLTPELVRLAVDVHVKDRKDDRYVLVGQGTLRWPLLLGRLRTLGYVGPITLESHLRGDREGIAESVRALQRWGVR